MKITIKQVGPDVGLFFDEEEKPRGFIRNVILTFDNIRDPHAFLERYADQVVLAADEAGEVE